MLFQPPPIRARLNKADGRLANSKVCGDRFLCAAISTDRSDHVLGYFRLNTFLASPLSSVSRFVGEVARPRIPTKVGQRIVHAIAIIVAAIGLCRRGANECLKNEAVHVSTARTSVPVQSYHGVFPRGGWRGRHNSLRYTLRMAGPVADSPGKRFNTPKIANLISKFKALYGKPRFICHYGNMQQIEAYYKRYGQR